MSWNAIDWQIILKHLTELCSAEVTQDKVADLRSFNTASDIKKEFEKVDNFRLLLMNHPRPSMESLDLFFTWAHRLEKAAQLKAIELRDLRHFCIETLALKETLEANNTNINKALSQELLNPEEPLSAIDQIINSDGTIRSDASEKLYNLYHEKNSLNKSISNTLDSLVKKHEMEGLVQDKFVTTREGRRVIPIKANMQGHFEGIIHSSSQSNKTVFMEPQEVIPLKQSPSSS
ncbi:MAG: hypothetical protein R2827_12535 [Bdellovibrionales bacterium]